MLDAPDILLVDEDRQIVEFLKQPLERNGYKVIAAKSPHSALTILQERLPDLLVLRLSEFEPDRNDLLKSQSQGFPALTKLAISGCVDGLLL